MKTVIEEIKERAWERLRTGKVEHFHSGEYEEERAMIAPLVGEARSDGIRGAAARCAIAAIIRGYNLWRLEESNLIGYAMGRMRDARIFGEKITRREAFDREWESRELDYARMESEPDCIWKEALDRFEAGKSLWHSGVEDYFEDFKTRMEGPFRIEGERPKSAEQAEAGERALMRQLRRRDVEQIAMSEGCAPHEVNYAGGIVWTRR